MPLKIKLKKFTAASGAPTTSDLEDGEVGINPVQQKVFVNNSGSIVELAGQSDLDLSAVSQDILPDGNGTRNLGSATKRFKELFLLGQTIDLGVRLLIQMVQVKCLYQQQVLLYQKVLRQVLINSLLL